MLNMTVRVLVFCAIVTGSFAANRTYTTKYDHLDLDEILNNDRIYKKYFECLTRRGKCTPDAKELREVLPEALKTGCTRCSEKQKLGAEKVIKFLITKKPTDFHELEKMYDPKGEYRKKYGELAEKRGIKI